MNETSLSLGNLHRIGADNVNPFRSRTRKKEGVVDNDEETANGKSSNVEGIQLPELDDDRLHKIQKILVRQEREEALNTIISALYGKLLVVMGIAFPIIDAISQDPTRFNGFYLFLNLGSIVFMMYSYLLLLQEETQVHPDGQRGQQVRYGSSYLRVGVAGFGIGSMILSGLEFGRYFEINEDAECHTLLIAISPIVRIIFVLMQMLYVFCNNQMCGDTRAHKAVVKVGLIHMIATNLCEWLYVLVEETKQDMWRSFTQNNGNSNSTILDGSCNITCWKSCIMQSLIQNSSPYLFPCTVEYSLLCAVILAVMWRNFCNSSSNKVMRRSSSTDRHKIPERSLLLLANRQSGVNIIYSKNASKYSVDCANSHKGIFSGIVILVLTIISLIMFFELAQVNIELAVLQVNIWETVLFGSAITATVACGITLRKVGFRHKKRRLELEHILLLVTQCGVFLYFLFQIFGGYYYFQKDDNRDMWRLLRMVTPIAALVQSSCQTVMVLDAWHRQCATASQIRRKPGRELVTFLLIANLALWIVNRLKNNSAEFHPMQMEFYGVWGWTVITHVSMPLVVCYRFQSTVCLYEIWKHVYKNNVKRSVSTPLSTIVAQ